MNGLDTPTAVGNNDDMTTTQHRVYAIRAGQDHAIWLADRMRRTPALKMTADKEHAYYYARRLDAHVDARALRKLLGDMWTVEVEPAS